MDIRSSGEHQMSSQSTRFFWGYFEGHVQVLVSLRFPGHGFKGHQVVWGIFGEYRMYQVPGLGGNYRVI